MTKRCLASVGEVDELIVIDDGSPILYKPGCDIYIHYSENGGYIKAANAGLEAATGDILILANNDLTFPENWLTELLRPLGEEYDIATCWTSDQADISTEASTTEGTRFGALFAMTRELYEATGGFDPDFRDYFGDLDLQQRAEELGFRVGRNNRLVVNHLAKATYKTVDEADDRYKYGMRVYESKYGRVD